MNSLIIQGVFFIYDSSSAVSDIVLLSLSRDKSYLFITSIWQGTKKCVLPTALGFPEDMNDHSVFSLEVPRFFLRVAPTMISKRFVKMSVM